ncbi:MAG: hypothetical protein ABI426_00420 [Flavobacterium sp.]
MIPLFSRNAIVGFSTLFLSVVAIYSFCSDYGWEDEGKYNSNFTPETFVDQSYRPLFLSSNIFYGDSGFDNGHNSRFNESMVKDWEGYLGKSMNPTDIKYFVVNDSSYNDMVAINRAILAKKEVAKWKSKFNIKDPKVIGFFDFLNTAKFVEKYSTVVPSWNYNTDSYNKTESLSVLQAKKVEKKYTDCKDHFLKNRFWFQAMKANFYSDNNNNATLFFNKTQAEIARNTLYYRGLSYIAGISYKNKQYSTSNFLYSIVFDNCPELRVVTAYSFHPQAQKDFDLSLQMAKTDKQKVALWTLYGYYADATEAAQKMYALDPKSEHLDLMLTRIINGEENKLNAISYKTIEEYRKIVKDKLSKNVYSLVTTIAQNKNTSKPYMWDIAAGYLEIFNQDYKKASQYFDSAEKTMPKTNLSQSQLRLIRLVNTLSSTNKMNNKSEKELLPELNWLYNLNKEYGYSSDFRCGKAINWSKNYISILYKSQNDLVMSEFFSRNWDFYLNPKLLESMKSFLEKKSKSPWENLAMSIYDVTLDDIYEFQAVKLAYQNQLDKAIPLMEKAGKNKEVVLLGNPFNGKIQDCHDCDHAAEQKIRYSKIDFLKKMQELQKNISQKKDVYNSNLLLANAFYNMSFYGNARVFYGGNITNQYGYDIDDQYKSLLLNNEIAKTYYQKAFEAAQDNEQKAKCVFLLTKIERNAFYLTSEFVYDTTDFKAFFGYEKLKKEYAQTQYYQEVINECGYFKKYAEK